MRRATGAMIPREEYDASTAAFLLRMGGYCFCSEPGFHKCMLLSSAPARALVHLLHAIQIVLVDVDSC